MVHSTAVQGSGSSAEGRETETERIKREGGERAVKTRNAFKVGSFSGCIVTLHYITLHYTTLNYITLHYTTLNYITLHYTTLNYITLHYIKLHYITLHYITLH